MPTVAPQLVIQAAWMTTALVWAANAIFVKPTARAEPPASRFAHLFLIAAALTLLFSAAARVGPLAWRLIPASDSAEALGAVLAVAGNVLAIWARVHLGANWSAAVAIKHNHSLVRSGPYRLVRHPIYSGFITATLGTAIATGELRGILAFAFAFGAWLAKSRQEESVLVEQFGEEYRRYRRQVKALVPFVL